MQSQQLLPKQFVSVLLALLCVTQLPAQTITIDAKNSENNIDLNSSRKTINVGLIKRKKYAIEVLGLNNAKYKVTVEPKFTRKKTEIPAILSPLIPKANSTEEKTLVKVKSNFVALFINDAKTKVKLPEVANVTTGNQPVLEELAPSLKLVFEKIDQNATILNNLKDAYEALYNESDDSKIVSGAKNILSVGEGDDVKTKLEEYEQSIIDAMNAFNANVALLEALVTKLSLDNFKAKFIEEYTRAKGSSQFVADNKDVFLKMVKFIGRAAVSTSTNKFKRTEVEGDYTTVEVKVIKTNKDLTTETYIVNQKFNNRNYIKWLNITTGFFANNLVSSEFALSTDKTDIITEKKFAMDVAVGAMANVNYVWRPEFKVGLGFGAALSPFDGKTRYLLGLSTTFGVRNEFALSGGLAWAKLQALSGSISSNGTDYDRPLKSTTVTVDKQSTNQATNVTTTTHDVTTTTNTFASVPTYSKWYSGIFIGITYSFLKR